MPQQNVSLLENGLSSKKQWKSIYLLGGIAAIIAIIGTISDIAIGFILGGNLSMLPTTAIERFAQFHNNYWLGLYNLDLLNIIIAIVMIPVFFALYAANSISNKPYSMLAMILFLAGTAIFITNNTALPMLELSQKYLAATSETQKTLLAAAGEAMLARGAHGSPGVFLGFALTMISELLISFVMLKSQIFSKATAYLGIIGGILLFIYIVLVTFAPAIKNVAMIIAAPGGILAIIWMIMFAKRLLKLSIKAGI